MLTLDELRKMTDVPTLVLGNDGLVKFVNDKFTEEFGWSPEDMVGGTLAKIFTSEYQSCL